MYLRKKHLPWMMALAWMLVSACQTPYHVKRVTSDCIDIDSRWDNLSRPEAVALLAPYKAHVDSVMSTVVGRSAQMMDRKRPEDLLQNLVADVLRRSAQPFIGKVADVGLVNIGGIRSSLPQGELTTSNIYEILPFENSLCIITLRGNALRLLLEQLSAVGGEGVSGVNLTITRKGKLLDARVGGKPIDPERSYTVATIDYLADGNDRLSACLQAEERICPPGKTLRALFMDYVKAEAAAGRAIDAKLEGRIVISKD